MLNYLTRCINYNSTLINDTSQQSLFQKLIITKKYEIKKLLENLPIYEYLIIMKSI